MDSGKDHFAPKPVHPRAAGLHAFFGVSYVRQHMITDEKWSPTAVTDQFKYMGKMLAHRLQFKKLESKANCKNILRENYLLRRQCRDGRAKLQKVMHGENTISVRNFLIDHKDMQRLYKHMPIHMVDDNINQRTFVMRKERDRLRCRLRQLKKEYELKLLERAELQNRIKYQDEFVLEEELKARVFYKYIENSSVRLQGVKTINATYQKMIQILRHDSIFYEPILKSLDLDIEDQENFIKHVLYIGMPGISKFQELSEEFRLLHGRVLKNQQSKIRWVADFKRSRRTGSNKADSKRPTLVDISARYLRETPTMNELKDILETVEGTIKQVKSVTLCSQAKEIFPQMKMRVFNNEKLKKLVENDSMGKYILGQRQKNANVLEGVLINNLNEEEISRLERIKKLRDEIEFEDTLEKDILQYIKNRGNIFILMRFTLWNLNDILRNVKPTLKSSGYQYKTWYLQLPLLKFEMLNLRSYSPDPYEADVQKLMNVVKLKITNLMKVFKFSTSRKTLQSNEEKYHHLYLDEVYKVESDSGASVENHEEEDEEFQLGVTRSVTILRKQIKSNSAKLVEEMSKRDD